MDRRAAGPKSAVLWYLNQAIILVGWSFADRFRARRRTAGLRSTQLHSASAREWRSDLADATRVFRRAPGYALTVSVTLGLALATTITVFAAVRGILLRDLPYPEPDRLVRIDRLVDGAPHPDGSVAYPDVVDWRERIAALEAIAVHTGYEGTYVAEPVAEIWKGRAVSSNLLDVLRIEPAMGGGFDGAAGAIGARTILISNELWTRRFDRNPEVIGQTVVLNAEAWEVVGVLRPGFAFPAPGVDFLIPLQEYYLDNRNLGFLGTVARLAPRVSLWVARQEVDAVVASIDAETGSWDEGVALRRYDDVEVANVRRIIWIFFGSVLLVLIVACANVAALALARAEARRPELAIRTSLGAGRGRIARHVLAESIALALAGGILGMVGGVIGVRVLTALAPVDLPRRTAIQVDLTVLLFAAAAAVATGVVVGWLPALRGARDGVATSSHGRCGSTEARGWRRTQEMLTGVQIALAVLLMYGAGLLLRSFVSLTAVNPGFRVEGTAVLELGLESEAYRGRNATLAFHDQLLERVRTLPGVVSAGLSTHLPFSDSDLRVNVTREGELYDRRSAPQVAMELFNGDYFETMGIPIIRGRGPSLGSDVQARQVVINETAAMGLWPGQDPLGRRFSFDVEEGQQSPPESWFTVVGLVPDVLKESLDRPPVATAYYFIPDFRRSYAFVSGRYFYLTVHTASDPLPLLAAMRDAVRSLDPALPIRASGTLEGMVEGTTVRARFRTFVLGAFAVLGVAVAFLGVYGVMAYSVSRGRREIGVRMALGASAAGEQRRVLLRAAAVVGLGAVAGMSGALGVGPVLASVLFEVPPRDPPTLAGVLGLAVVGTLVAAYLPARRASRVDPMQVLREA